MNDDRLNTILERSAQQKAIREREQAAAESQRAMRAGKRDAYGNVTSRRKLGPAYRVDYPQVTARYKAGEDVPQIAETMGIATQTIYRHLRNAGINLRPRWGKDKDDT